MRDLEHQIQVGCVNWFRLQYPNLLIYAIPNGSKRNLITAVKLKAEGVVSGVPDLHIPVARHGYHGLYIEMKNGKKGVVSQNQKDIMKKLTEEGYRCEVCRSLDDFMKVTKDYLSA